MFPAVSRGGGGLAIGQTRNTPITDRNLDPLLRQGACSGYLRLVWIWIIVIVGGATILKQSTPRSEILPLYHRHHHSFIIFSADTDYHIYTAVFLWGAILPYLSSFLSSPSGLPSSRNVRD